MSERVHTAVLLAAGTGSRLQPLTESAPKCLTEVNGVPILRRLAGALSHHGFKKLVVVIGHLGDQIRRFLAQNSAGLSVEFVENPIYATTNNLYSLWLARASVRESFLLAESDLVFDQVLLGKLQFTERAAVDLYNPTNMSGTTVLVDEQGIITQMDVGQGSKPQGRLYKTLNMYSLSLSSWNEMIVRMDKRVASNGVNDYYEVVLAEMIRDKRLLLQTVDCSRVRWIEVDNLDDLRNAEKLFADESNGGP